MRKKKRENGWTMVYNEGMEIRIEKMKILVFNKYFKDGEKFKSNCGKTLIGWYRTESEEYGCIRGEKKDGKDIINDNNLEGNIVL